jgi:hypothetical protein
MSFLFKAKLSYNGLVHEAKTYTVPLKFYKYAHDLLTLYMLVPVGSSGIMYMYFCEENVAQENLAKTIDDLQRIGFIEVEAFETPLP